MRRSLGQPIIIENISGAVFLPRKMMRANGLNEFIAWLKANPNKASVGVV
jgi:hypothetical protein